MTRLSKMLVIAPHPDDEVLGAGGTIARHSAAGGHVTVLTVTAMLPPLFSPQTQQQRVNEALQAHAVLGVHRSVFLDIPSLSPNQVPIPELNRQIFQTVQEVEPDIMLLPYSDRHIDHKMVFKSCMVIARPVDVGRRISLVAAYETLSQTHWNAPNLEPNFTPNWFVNITDYFETKREAMYCYRSQLQEPPLPRTSQVLEALARFRGSQSGMELAEGFHLLRLGAGTDELFIQ